MPTYERCGSEITMMAAEILAQFDTHHPLLNAKIKIDLVFAFAERDERGFPIEVALKKNGVQALGIARKINLKDRVLGRGDAEVSLDGDWWQSASDGERKALLDHELHHLALKLDKHGRYLRDACNRPVLKLRQHDYDLGWFKIIAVRHKGDSQEVQQARKLVSESGQYFWPAICRGRGRIGESLRSQTTKMSDERTLGSLCAGIGGFDEGFRQAGWQTIWQCELDDVNRAVLADRYPDSVQRRDLRDWKTYSLPPVACITAGFPCQDISVMANMARDQSRRGLKGNRSGLFYTIMEIVSALRPSWVVLENVRALLHSNDCQDFEIVVRELAERGYVGYARVLNAQYFGVPQSRRRIFLVAGLGRFPHRDFLADAGAVEALPVSLGSSCGSTRGECLGWLYSFGTEQTTQELDMGKIAAAQISAVNFSLLRKGDGQMVERARASQLHGLRAGLDAANIEEAYAAGNAVPPAIAKWIAEILNRS